MNLGALIGGLAVLVALAVCLCCLSLAGIGPKCLTCLRLRCRGGGIPRVKLTDVKFAQPAKPPPTTEVPVQLQNSPAKCQKAAKRPLPSVPPAAKSAPDPPRVQAAETPVTPLSLTEDRTSKARGFLKPSTLRRYIDRLPRHQPLTPASATAPKVPWFRRGLSSTHLSLSTIRDPAAPLPPDCLYETDAYLLDRKAASTPTPLAESTERLQRSTAATSLKAEIGSAYGRVLISRHSGRIRPQSNSSSSDCRDWSPRQPPQARRRQDEKRRKRGGSPANQKRGGSPANQNRGGSPTNQSRAPEATKVGRRRPSYEPRFRLVNETVEENAVWASTDGEITIFDLDGGVGGGATLSEFAEAAEVKRDHSTSF